MLTYFLRHLNLLAFTLLILCVLSFLLAYMFPGDPLANLSGQLDLSAAEHEALVQKYAFDQGMTVQFLQYLQLLMQGDWGLSFSSRLPLYEDVWRTLPASIELSAYTLLLSLLIGLPLGFLAGFRHYGKTDISLLGVSVLSYSIPVFWLALLLIMVFCLQLGWLPLSGRIGLLFDVPQQTGFILIDIPLSDLPNKSEAFRDAFQHLILPTLAITVVTFTVILRITRRSVIEVLQQDYIQAAYSRGLSHRQVFMRHVVRNALLPILPMLATQFTALLTNAMIVEIIFSWPGIGNWLIQAIYQRDYPAIRAGMLVVASLVVIFTVSMNILFKFVDPTSNRSYRVSV